MTRKTIRNVITSNEKLRKVNVQNIKLLEDFLSEKNIRCATGTIDGYRSDMNIFFVYVLENLDNKFYVDIHKLEFAKFFNYCVTELHWGSARFNRMRSCLSSLGDFIEKYMDDKYPMFHNSILKVIDSMPHNAVRTKTILSEEQVNKLLCYLSTNNRHQEACLLALAISSGARFSELMRFTTDIIDLDNLVYSDIFIETTKKIKTKGRTKTGELKYQYIIKSTFEKYYVAWMSERSQIMTLHKQTHNHIFINLDGTPAPASIVRRYIPLWEKYLGINIYFHAFRHYIVTFLSRLGLTGDLISEIMGWRSADMYKIYNDLTGKDKEWKELDKLKNYLITKV